MKTAIIAMLRLYKRLLSPALPHACRYLPTCSEYAMEAVERHGAVRGTSRSRCGAWRGAIRLAEAGFDPVPPGRFDKIEHHASHGCART
jgi:putative membrane protein insertion efficiency factor